MADPVTAADAPLPTMASMAEGLATRVDALETSGDSGDSGAPSGSDPAPSINVSVKDVATEAGGGASANDDALARALAENAQLREQLSAAPPPPAAPVVVKDPPAQVSGLRYAAMRELGDDAPTDLLDEFAAKLADEVYLERALAHDGLSAEDKAKAGRQLATVRHHMRAIRTEAATKELQRSRDKAPADDDAKAKDSEASGPADLDSMRESLAASLVDEASLVEVEKVWPGFVGAVRAGVIRPDDDLVSMIGDVANESEARESLARVCGLLDRVCARLNFAAEAPADDAKTPPSGRAVADPASLAFRRDESRAAEVTAFPTAESFEAELTARVAARGQAN